MSTKNPSEMTEKDRAEALTKALMERGAAEDQKVIEDILDAITEPPKKIPEPVFRELFLPFFLGEKPASEEENILAHWIGVVGSASYPADVVDVKGETLFQVPPVYDTSKLNVSQKDRGAESFVSIAKNYQDAVGKTPVAGQNYLAHALGKKIKSNLPENSTSKYSWEPVLQFYGLVPEKANKNNGGSGGDVDMSDFTFSDE